MCKINLGLTIKMNIPIIDICCYQRRLLFSVYHNESQHIVLLVSFVRNSLSYSLPVSDRHAAGHSGVARVSGARGQT